MLLYVLTDLMQELISNLDTSIKNLSRSSLKQHSNTATRVLGARRDKHVSLREEFSVIQSLREDEWESKRPILKSVPMLNHALPGRESSVDLSFETESARLRDERRLVSRKELKPAAEEVLKLVYEYLARTCDQELSKELLQLWAHHRKASTVNGYANNFKLWMEYCYSEGESPLPPKPFVVAAWLAAISLKDNTASPTDARCAAINYFSKIANTPSITHSPVVEMTKESIRRKLGYKNQQKLPLRQDHIDSIVTYFLWQESPQGIANAFRVTLAYEATLRWDDFKDMVFGDFIVTNDFVRVFLVDTKTDSYKSGQWATFAVSDRPTSAYQLLQKLMEVMAAHSSQEVRDNMSNMPVMFRTTVGLFVDASSSRINYNEFLAELKTACSAVGLDPNLFGTHSMRRGSTTDQFMHGIPDKVIKLSGRWKSNAFERYIDQGQLLQLQLQSLKSRELRLKGVGGIGKLSSITPPTHNQNE